MTALVCYHCGRPCAEVDRYLDVPMLVQAGILVEGYRLYSYRHPSCAATGDGSTATEARRANRRAILDLCPWTADTDADRPRHYTDPSERCYLVTEYRRGRQRLRLALPDGSTMLGERPAAATKSGVVPQWFRRAVACVHAHGGLTRAELGHALEFYRAHRAGDWTPAPEAAAAK